MGGIFSFEISLILYFLFTACGVVSEVDIVRILPLELLLAHWCFTMHMYLGAPYVDLPMAVLSMSC